MRTGFTLKEAAGILGIHERRVTQSLDPTLVRIARLWRADASKTMASILEAVNNLEPMEDQEIEIRRGMATGRLDRSVLHPQR
jgi:hypothetical protein